jgi:hypothetical protein
MYVLSQILLALSKSFRIQYDCGAGKTKNCFPRSSAKKKDRPKFLVLDHASPAILWQICAGTKIKDKQGNEHGIDISLQTHDSPDVDPDFGNAVIIWECKFKDDPGNNITKPEYETFAGWIKRLGLVAAVCPPGFLTGLTALNGNALVTNGGPSTYTSRSRLSDGLREVANFYPGETHTVYK